MKEYKCIIAGSRSFVDTQFAFDVLDNLDFKITEVISGTANGADRIGEAWALARGIPVTKMPASWEKHGAAAGPIRNRAMAEYVGKDGACVIFWNGESPGSRNMKETAEKLGLKVVLPC